ncbi:MAG: hypothetical protein WC610_00605 [Patescibacteria group bacterium]
MTLKQLMIIMFFATMICWAIWVAVLFQIDPNESGITGFFMFYASLFFALLGSFFLASFGWRKLFSKFVMDYKIVATSFRQSIFFALLVVGILLLQSKDLLTWWNIILIIAALTIIESLFLSARRQI